MNSSTIVNIFLALACGFVVLMVLLFIGAFFAMRQLQRFIAPDLATMQRNLETLRRDHPDMISEALIRKIIQQQSFKCGLVGALAGLGGFITLPVALPADILLSLRIQSVMVQFIAMIYNEHSLSTEEMKLQTTLVMSGGVELTDTTTSLIMKGIARLLGESLSIIVPAIGIVVGFVVNYGIAQATGNIAMRFYGSRGGATRPMLSTRGR